MTTTAAKIIKAKDLSVGKVEFGKLCKKEGKHIVPITHDKQAVILQMRKIKIDNALVNERHEVADFATLSDVSGTISQFVKSLETLSRDAAFNNSVQWFKKEIPETVINDFFKSSFRNETNLLECAVQFTDGNPTVRCFDRSNKEAMDIRDVNFDQPCDCIVHIEGLKFYKKSFSLIINVIQLQASPCVVESLKELDVTEYAFVESDEDEKNHSEPNDDNEDNNNDEQDYSFS
jgi:hypothetical protein